MHFESSRKFEWYPFVCSPHSFCSVFQLKGTFCNYIFWLQSNVYVCLEIAINIYAIFVYTLHIVEMLFLDFYVSY